MSADPLPLARELVAVFEGFEAKPYLCPGGHSTIGYGHVIRPGEDFAAGIDRVGAELLLDADLRDALVGVDRHVGVLLHPFMRAALISFVFNLGVGAFAGSTLRKRVNERRWSEAEAELGRWIHAGGKPLKGLKLRREAEAALFRCGVLLLEQGR